jgi:hypothetical protein
MAREAGVPAHRLERALGSGAGTVDRLFAGRGALHLRHILVILETLGIPPARFFRIAFPEEEAGQDDADLAVQLQDLLERLGPSQRERPPQEAEVSAEELDRRIEEALQRMGVRPPTLG